MPARWGRKIVQRSRFESSNGSRFKVQEGLRFKKVQEGSKFKKV
jgi:hypothetical protein